MSKVPTLDTLTACAMWLSAAGAAASTSAADLIVGDEARMIAAAMPWLVAGAVAGAVRIAVLLGPSVATPDRPTWGRCIAILVSAPFVALVVGIIATHFEVASPGRIVLVLAGGYQSERLLRSYDTVAAAVELSAPAGIAKWIERKLSGRKPE